MPPSTSPSLRRRRLALALGTVAAGWAAVVVATGGVSTDLAGLRVSSRSAWRPAALAVGLVVLALWRAPAEMRRRMLADASGAANRYAPWIAVALALAMTGVAVMRGEHVAGGSDSSGYLNQSRLWGAGRVATAAPVLADVPWPDRGWLVAPLGFRPTVRPGELGPTYAPGLPWLMALGAAVAGEAGRFVWTPLFVGLLVWGTYRLAAGAAPPAAALAAALLVAGSPPVLFEAMHTMSDIPAAALWTWTLVGLRKPGVGAAAGAGMLAAVALLVRPNLVLAAAGVWMAALAGDPAPWRVRIRHAALRAAPLALAALAIAAINTRLWGSPVISGYGTAGELFSAANVLPNLADVWQWTAESRSSWTVLGAVALLSLAARRDGRAWWPALAVAAGVLASYLPYARFGVWWYLRFYLPMWPVVAAALAVAAWRLVAMGSRDAASLALVAAAAGLALAGTADAHARGVFAHGRGEQRYAAVGRYVAAHTATDAVVFAAQHSGALTYYSGRTIARFDELPADALDRLCTALAAAGRQVWLVAEDWEEPAIRARFATQARGGLDWAPVAEARVGAARVRLYDMTAPTRANGPALIPMAAGGPWPWARGADTPAQ